MKTSHAFIWAFVLGILFNADHLFAQGTTAFTYQGQLKDGGTNANGSYLMTFTLYDSPTDPTNQLGSPIVTSPTLVNGLFTVNLDFGNVFDGNARWLDIIVKAGTNAPEELSPRVRIMPSPYALYSTTAGNSTTAGGLSSGGWSAGVGNYATLTNVFLIFDNGSPLMALSTNGSYIPTLSLFPDAQTYAANGTFVVPSGVNKIKVEMWGGGGAGGTLGSQNTNSINYYAGGGGGGAGAYSVGNFEVTPGDSYPVTVGTGGVASIFVTSARNGGTSSISNGSGTLMSAGGGSVGGDGSVSYPTFTPGNGGSGGDQTNSDIVFESGNGQDGSANTGGAPLGGVGASAHAGGSGGWGNGGENGKMPGGGGGGGSPGVLIGGNGGAGMVIIYY